MTWKITVILYTLSLYTLVQIVLGSRMILEIRTSTKYFVRASVYYCKDIRKTVWDKYTPCVENTSTSMCSINYRKHLQKDMVVKRHTTSLDKANYFKYTSTSSLDRRFTWWHPIPTTRYKESKSALKRNSPEVHVQSSLRMSQFTFINIVPIHHL